MVMVHRLPRAHWLTQMIHVSP